MTNRKYFIAKMWASDVKKRDSKKCLICGSKKELEAHHIFGIAQYPYLTAELNNGVTLCKTCHNKYHEQYKDINAITWTKFLLDNQYKITKLEINYSNGYKEKIPITFDPNQTQPLLNNNIKSTIIYEIQTSEYDNSKIPYEWLTTRLNNKYGIKNDKIIKELAKLENSGLIHYKGENVLELKI